MVNALGFQRRCYRVIGHLRARLFAGKTAFLDARSAQHAGWKGFAFSHETRNSCPTIGFDITRFSATTCIRWPGPLLDAWTGLLGASRRPGFRPNVVEHTMLAPSRKAVSGRAASRPACLAGRASSARCAGPLWGSYFAQRATPVLRRQAEPKKGDRLRARVGWRPRENAGGEVPLPLSGLSPVQHEYVETSVHPNKA